MKRRLDLEHTLRERKYVASGVPGSGPSSSTMIPEWSSPSSSSRSERIIPRDISPRSLASPSGSPSPGSWAPGKATATVAPSPKFHAPQTIWRASPSPTSTGRAEGGRHSDACRLQAHCRLGTARDSRPRSAHAAPDDPIDLDARQDELGRQLIRAGRRSSTYSRSQETGTFISELLQEAGCRSPRRARMSGSPCRRNAIRSSPEAEREALPPSRGRSRRTRTRSGSTIAGAADLDPARLLADRGSRAVAEEAGQSTNSMDGSVNGKKLGPHARSRARPPKSGGAKCCERPAQVGQRDVAVDGERLHLVEDRRSAWRRACRAGRRGRATPCRSGGSLDSIVRICDGEVWVRRTAFGPT